MSPHPFGLSEDPFDTTAELSVEEATQLMRGRVAAAGGDAMALLPDEACAEIHKLARGRRGGVFALAGRALRLAAEEGAAAVALSHVHAAVAEAVAQATQQAEASEPAPIFRTVSTSADDDPIPDLPPIEGGGMMLPTEPSPELAPDERDWVRRFMKQKPEHKGLGGSRPEPRASREVRPVQESAPEPRPMRESTPAPAPARPVVSAKVAREPEPAAAATTAPEPAPAGPLLSSYTAARLGKRRRSNKRGRRTSSGVGRVAGWAIGGAAVIAIGFVVVNRLPRIERAAQAPKTTVTVSAPLTTAPTNTAPLTTAGPMATTAPMTPAATATPSEAPRRTVYGVEVATFIFSDRAEEERNRLIGMGQTARVQTTLENGSPSYHVVLGRFRNRTAAEHTADTLISAGTVQEARVVRLSDDD